MRGRVALITGGASGIGAAIGRALATRGAKVVLADRQATLAAEVADDIHARGGEALPVELDVRDADAFADVAAEARDRFGSLDYFFNNAGIAIGGEIADHDKGTWDSVLDVNVRGVAYGIDAVYPIMRAQGSGHIVNTASTAGLLGIAGVGAYTASKHAVVGISKVLRVEAERYGVRVSALCPGAINTPILKGGTFGGQVGPQLTEADAEKLMKLMRPMNVDDFARVVLQDVDNNEAYIIVPRYWKAIWLLERAAPRLVMKVWSRFHKHALKIVEQSAAENAVPSAHDQATPRPTAG